MAQGRQADGAADYSTLAQIGLKFKDLPEKAPPS